MKITLRQLRVFDAVARLGNVSRAADEVSVSQSAASMSLADLEGHLDADLFHRQGKRLVLNDYGRWLQPKVHQLLLQAMEIESSAGSTSVKGQLQVGASSTIGNYLVPGLIAEYVEQHVDTKIDLKVANTEQVVDDMLNLRIDIGLIEGLCHTQDLHVEPWKADTLKIFCGLSHPLAKQGSLALEDLAQEAWILREPGSGTREIFMLATQDKLSNLKVKLELGNSEAIKNAVKKGWGLGCLSELAIQDALDTQQLKEVAVVGLDLSRELFVVSRPGDYQSQLLSSFKEHLFNGI